MSIAYNKEQKYSQEEEEEKKYTHPPTHTERLFNFNIFPLYFIFVFVFFSFVYSVFAEGIWNSAEAERYQTEML